MLHCDAVPVPATWVQNPKQSKIRGTGAGMSQDGRRRFARLNFKIDDLRAGQRILGLRRKHVDFGEE
jgi:hypothetical protein